ncbi:four helix bundle protein [Chryseobacterium indologenes]|nr:MULTISPECIES: four helix bundle protein [Chryseobacterium]ASE64421.1 four helix bundle protein [Chryseobacterium indologenes]AYZ38256.1 four helix bundle protein [Chryseobacterium indologenes]MBF6645861.1 four helix bundle protein [Chryseobacterium indologenes]MBU3048391.1 four helix bundle protein [Chryseobacterium indologenes]QPQ53883.1 four helix bundle protein [Chryseobacterium indologenes]
MKSKNVLKDKSFTFSIHIIEQYKRLTESKEYVMSKQLLRSGTAVGALIREAEFAQSKADFISKLSISLKEANETSYWLELLHRTQYIDTMRFEESSQYINELISMLVSSIKTSKLKLNT